MNKILRLFITLFVLLTHDVFAQTQGIVNGVVRGGDTPVPGAIVTIKGNTTAYAVADSSGTFRINAPKKLPFTLLINSVGYKTQEVEVYELSNEPFEISLIEDGLLEEIVVTSRRSVSFPYN